MEFKLKDSINPRILEDLGFTYERLTENNTEDNCDIGIYYSGGIWKYNTNLNCKITLRNNELSMPLVLYYLIKLDLIEII